MADIYLTQRTLMNDKYPYLSESGLHQYHDQDIVVSVGSDWRAFDTLPPNIVNKLKRLKREGHNVINGVSPFFPQRIVIDEDVEVYNKIRENDEEFKRLKNLGLNF